MNSVATTNPDGASARLLASGIDTLNLSVTGAVRAQVWEGLESAKAEAQESDDDVGHEFPVTGQAFRVAPAGRRGYPFVLRSPDFDLAIGKGDRFPAVLVELRSAYLHSVGIRDALELVRLLLRHDVLIDEYPPTLKVSRIDLYADMQGWVPDLIHLSRFVTYARNRHGRTLEGAEVRMAGPRVNSFRFGQGGPLLARIYDKTLEIATRGVTWLPDLWGDRLGDVPVWRTEFQMRRQVIKQFDLAVVEDVVGAMQDLWRYCTHEWLTLRQPPTTGDTRLRRWPLDPWWEAVQAVEIAPQMVGVVRRRIAEADERRLLQGLTGYATSLAALRNRAELRLAMADHGLLMRSYLAEDGREFSSEVRRKRDRQLSVTAADAAVGARTRQFVRGHDHEA